MTCAPPRLNELYSISDWVSIPEMVTPPLIRRDELSRGFGDRLYGLRLDLSKAERDLGPRKGSVSQRAIGERIAVLLAEEEPRGGNTVSQWENGEAMPDCLTMVALAQVFGVDPGWLAFGGDHSMAPSGQVNPRAPLVNDEDEATIAETRSEQQRKKDTGTP